MEGETSGQLKNPKGKPVDSGQRMIIINLYKSLKIEQPEMKYTDIIARLSKMTGIGLSTIKKTISEYRRTGTVSSPKKTKNRLSTCDKLTDDQKARIRQKVLDFWIQQELPNLKKLLAAVNEDKALPNFTRMTLWRTLRELGFKYTKNVIKDVDTESSSDEDC